MAFPRKLRIRLLRLTLLPIIPLAMFVGPSWRADGPLSFAVEAAGYFFLLAGLCVRLWSILYIGGRKSKTLVTEGPYSVCRNPLYIGSFLLAVGASLCFQNVLMLAVGFFLLLPIHAVVVRMEEQGLREKFPEQFDDYCRRVPRFWPRLRGYRAPEHLEVSTRMLRRVAIDTAGILLIPLVEDFVELLHSTGHLPLLLKFP